MEVEIDLRNVKGWVYGIGGFLLLAVWLFGYFVTPADGTVLTMQQWQLRKAAKAYRAELARLQDYCAEVAGLIEDEQPNPVQAQVLASRVQSDLQDGQEALSEARALVIAAAQAVRAWSVGQVDYDTAAASVAEAAAYLQQFEAQP